MDAAVDAFVSQIIQEILVSCGLNGSEDEEVKCCVTQLSTYMIQGAECILTCIAYNDVSVHQRLQSSGVTCIFVG